MITYEKRTSDMRTVTVCFAFMFFLSVATLSAKDCFAIGQWHKGIVTRSPWADNYSYIQIDKVRYTIMKNATIVEVYEKKGATYRSKINLYSILDGHRLVYKNEGNRIYQIEKIR